MEYRNTVLAISLPCLFVPVMAGLTLGCQRAAPMPLPDAKRLTANARLIDGSTYSFVDGNAYKLDKNAKTWNFEAHVYDPDFLQKNYVVRDGKVFRSFD